MITTEDSVTLQKHHKVREEGTTDHMSILDFISEEMHCGTAGQFKGTQYFLLSRWWETFSVDTVIFNKFKYFLWLNIYIIILGINIEILHSMAELYLFYMIRIFMTLTKNIKKIDPDTYWWWEFWKNPFIPRGLFGFGEYDLDLLTTALWESPNSVPCAIF